MGWGQARRPSVSNKISYPNPKEGSDGDIQVRQTNLGAKLFGKLGGRWLSTNLFKDNTFSMTNNSGRETIKLSADTGIFADQINLTGKIALTSSVGSQNICIGTGNVDIGTNNITIGVQAGTALIAGSENNIFIGKGAGAAVTTGDKNVYIGTDCGNTTTTANNNVLIGYDNDVNANSRIQAVAIGNENVCGSYGVALGFNNDVTAGTGYCFAIGQDLTVSSGQIWIGNGGSGYNSNQWLTTAAWSHSSDRRIKKNIKREGVGLDFINDLHPSQFEYKPQNEYPESFKCYKEDKDTPIAEGTFYGLIAQEVKESVDKYNAYYCKVWDDNDPDGIQFIGEGHLVVPLIKAVQELSAKIDTMQTQINNLTTE